MTLPEETYAEAMARSHLSCLLACLPENEDGSVERPDSTVEAEARLVLECAAFIMMAGDDLDQIDAHDAGADLFFTREGHGTGFWDRDLEEVGDRLSALAKKMGPCEAWVDEHGNLSMFTNDKWAEMGMAGLDAAKLSKTCRGTPHNGSRLKERL